MTNKTKHKILKALNEKEQEGEQRSGNGITVTESGRSMTNIEIHKKTKIPIQIIDDTCLILINEKQVNLFENNNSKKAHTYLITDEGKKAFFDRIYLNKIWYKQSYFWLALLPIVISLLSLFWTIRQDVNKQKDIDKIKEDLIEIQNKVK